MGNDVVDVVISNKNTFSPLFLSPKKVNKMRHFELSK